MIYYLLLLCMPVVNCCQSVSQKQYNLKCEKGNVILFSAVTSVIALGFFLVTSGLKLQFTPALIPYSLGFAVCYAAGWVSTVLAVRYGLMAITTMIVSCSLIFPTVYGVMTGEPLTATIAVGVALLLFSFVLVNLKFDKSARFTWKWFACAVTACVANGGCSIAQSMQKRVLGENFSHEFMILALAAASVMLLAYAMVTGRNLRGDFRACLPYATGNGIANGLINLLVLVTIGHIPNTVLYPSLSALNMVATFVLSFIMYKERFSKVQYAGYALGIVSIVLLNL